MPPGRRLGKPVWLLNRVNTCWRWQLDAATRLVSLLHDLPPGQYGRLERGDRRVRSALQQYLGQHWYHARRRGWTTIRRNLARRSPHTLHAPAGPNPMHSDRRPRAPAACRNEDNKDNPMQTGAPPRQAPRRRPAPAGRHRRHQRPLCAGNGTGPIEQVQVLRGADYPQFTDAVQAYLKLAGQPGRATPWWPSPIRCKATRSR
jgi:hypothetical protein